MTMTKLSRCLLVATALAVIAVGVSSQNESCGREGNPPCGGGDGPEDCDFMHVPAPEGYHLAAPGLCTHCGDLYQPPCLVPSTEVVGYVQQCATDSIENDLLIEGNMCVPNPYLPGCGTHARAPCPDEIPTLLGSPVIDWTLRNGCVYSEIEPRMRFTIMPVDLLPLDRKCARVCVACGLPGHPWCETKPHCIKAPNQDLQFMPDEVKIEYCKQEDMCGTPETSPCAPGFLTAGDEDQDGCYDDSELVNGVCVAQPFGDLDQRPIQIPDRKAGLCADGLYPQVNETAETVCRPFCVGDECAVDTKVNCPDVHDRANEAYAADPNNAVKLNQCVPCGSTNQPPCSSIPYGGCRIQLGLIPHAETGSCQESPCGRGGTPPFGSSECGVEAPSYVQEDGCLLGHHLRGNLCVSCGLADSGNPESEDKGIVKCELVGCEFHIEFQPETGEYSHLVEAGSIITQTGEEKRCISDVDLNFLEEGMPQFPKFLEHGVCASDCEQGFQQMYQQCGGIDWDGSICCDRLTRCDVVDEKFSLCVPSGECSEQRDAGLPIVCLNDQCSGEGYQGSIDCEPGTFCEQVETDFGICSASELQARGVSTTQRADDFINNGAQPILGQCADGRPPVPRFEQCAGDGYTGSECCYGYNVCLPDPRDPTGTTNTCTAAILPESIIGYGLLCDINDDRCEPGAICTKIETGDTICEPAAIEIKASKETKSHGALIGGLVFLLLILPLLICAALFLYKRKGSEALRMSFKKSFPFVGQQYQKHKTEIETLQTAQAGIDQTGPVPVQEGKTAGKFEAAPFLGRASGPDSAFVEDTLDSPVRTARVGQSYTVHSVVWGEDQSPAVTVKKNQVFERSP